MSLADWCQQNQLSLPKDIHWQLQLAKEEDWVFYRPTNLETFHERREKNPDPIIILDRSIPSLPAKTYVVSKDQFLKFQEEILNKYYPLPQKKLIGLTGTNGKTTTVELCRQLCQQISKKGVTVGTLGVYRHDGEHSQEETTTTPSFIGLRKILHKELKSHDFAFIEVSSHAITQERVYNIPFSLGAFLSFSRDHLDFHQDMDDYLETKISYCKKLPICFTSQEVLPLFPGTPVRNILEFNLEGKFCDALQVDFNQKNLACALEIMEFLVGPQKWKVENLTPPPGRLETYKRPGKTVIIDSAHTPDALEKLCSSLITAFPTKKIVLVFGCGGDRDKGKRSEMGKIAQKYAHKIILTSDNPRTEDPQKILEDIQRGISQEVQKIIDRKSAITSAYNQLSSLEILVIPGKGHEDYQIVGHQKFSYNDGAFVSNLMDKHDSC